MFRQVIKSTRVNGGSCNTLCCAKITMSRIRDMVIFAQHNVLQDPPFTRVDLITCRNMLIYFEPALQQKIIPAFHYALKPDGFLVLGSSESVGQFHNLF